MITVGIYTALTLAILALVAGFVMTNRFCGKRKKGATGWNCQRDYSRRGIVDASVLGSLPATKKGKKRDKRARIEKPSVQTNRQSSMPFTP